MGNEEINYVDFDPECLEYVRRFYREAQSVHKNSEASVEESTDMDNIWKTQHRPPVNYHLRTKIIVLREELEYYCLPGAPKPSDEMTKLKRACGEQLRENDTIFDALQKNIEKENNVAEQHLIDMLCESGFKRQDRWGYRALEPMRTCVVSMSLVQLTSSGSEEHIATAQKLLLFWRKPAVSVICFGMRAINTFIL